MKNIPYWSDNNLNINKFNCQNLSEEVDILIIGGGYSGLNCARILAKKNLSVL